MIDFSFIGKAGMMIDYEDIISMVGYNIIHYLKSNDIKNDNISKMSDEDILLSYINRPHEEEDIRTWISENFNIDVKIEDYLESEIAFRPNLIYAFKIFHEAYRSDVKNLMVHTEYDSPAVRNIMKTFDVPVTYVTGDIHPILSNNMNITYTTSSTKNITACLDIEVPIALTIVDEFQHISPVLKNDVVSKLRSNNKYVCFTNVLSGGFI